MVSGHRLAAVAASEDHAKAAGGGEVVLSIDGVRGGRLRDVALEVRAGEIVGVAGLLGSGTEDLPYVLFGAVGDGEGRISISDWSGEISDLDPAGAQRLGVALVPADRKQLGVAAALSVEKNMLSLVLGRYVRRGVLAHRQMHDTARKRSETYDVRPRNPSASMNALSGGNQQRWCSRGGLRSTRVCSCSTSRPRAWTSPPGRRSTRSCAPGAATGWRSCGSAQTSMSLPRSRTGC